MNTPAHLLLGAAAFGKRESRAITWAAMLGGLLPDLSLYILAGASLLILNIPESVVFNELYFSDAWQTVFAIDNSFLVWGALLALAIWWRSGWAIALTLAALLHIALDFPLHHDDGRPHFWPLSDWVFESPVSYWDRAHGALWVAPVEALMALLAAILIWRRKQGWLLGLATLFLVVAQMNVGWVWMFVFTTG